MVMVQGDLRRFDQIFYYMQKLFPYDKDVNQVGWFDGMAGMDGVDGNAGTGVGGFDASSLVAEMVLPMITVKKLVLM